ncbi:MAG: choice-of-anchor B family protein, partial [Gemmatimonadetes bacterium]|nr:choice-of-anchor B family protein [Gemmatimonadota bacterium]
DEEHAGKEICFGANETHLSIADVTDKSNPVALSRASYPNVAYSHQGWPSDDHKYFFLNDELDELSGTQSRTRTLVWDIQDLDDPILLTEYMGETAASDHNLYVRGNLVYESNYVSGLRILDISDPANPVEVAHFDTVPWGPDAPGFAGSWSNYPYFQSGNIIVSSMREGLFIVRKRERPVS